MEDKIKYIIIVLKLTKHELRYRPSKTSMLPQNHCGNEEDGCISQFIYIFIYIYISLHFLIFDIICFSDIKISKN